MHLSVGGACSAEGVRVTSPHTAVALSCRTILESWIALSCLVLVPVLGAGCKAKTPAITEPFLDNFERGELGATWLDTSGKGRVVDGKLNVTGALNHPLWLRKRLPRDVVVEVDVMSKSPDGDIKLELFADGESFDPDQGTYYPTGYVFVFGGWQNRYSIIGRLGEHDDGEKVRVAPAQGAPPPVEAGRTYHFTITRKGGDIDWKIDGQPFLSWKDPQPLTGEKHEFLGITNWQTDVYYDNLKISPAP